MSFVKKDGLKKTTDEGMHKVVEATEVRNGKDAALIVRQVVVENAREYAQALGYEK